MKILYLDPDRSYARRLLTIFHKDGSARWLVHYSRDLASGISRIQRERFDAILISTAKMDDGGIVAISSIKRKCPGCPIVVLTSAEQAHQVLDSAAHDIQDILVREETEPDEIRLRVELAIAKVENQHSRESSKSMKEYNSDRSVRTDTRNSRVRVLQIEGDPSYGHLLQSTLGKSDSNKFDVHRVSQLADGLKSLMERQYDAVLIELDLPDCEANDTIERIQPFTRDIPVVAITDHQGEEIAKESVKSGIQDFLVKSQADIRGIERSLKMALARFEDQRAKAPPTPPPVLCTNRPKRPTYRTDKTVSVITVHESAPGNSYDVESIAVNRKTCTLEFILPDCTDLPSDRIVVGIYGEDELQYFATAMVVACETCEFGLLVTVHFANGIDDLLHPSNIVPKLDSTSVKFGPSVSSEALNQWASLGIIRPMILDRVLVCPHCQGVPTFREGCVSCGSTRTVSTQMMRHRACSHVAPFDDFLSEHKVDCPNCSETNLVAGIDLDYVDGPYRCLDCEWNDSETTMVGQCLSCKERFLTPDALQLELIGYSCNRLKTDAIFRDPAEVTPKAEITDVTDDLWSSEEKEDDRNQKIVGSTTESEQKDGNSNAEQHQISLDGSVVPTSHSDTICPKATANSTKTRRSSTEEVKTAN
jgi:DNA-binding NarL/FixJ family response regulator